MRVLASLLAVFLFTASQSSSTAVFTIRGTVVDPAGRPLPGVAVELRQGTSVLRSVVSDSSGNWSFSAVKAGEYRVRTRLAGFETTEIVVPVATSEPPPVTLMMKVGAATEVVTLITAPPVVGEGGSVGTGSGRAVAGGVGESARSAPAPPSPAATPPSQSVFASQDRRPPQFVPVGPSDSASYGSIVENRFRSVQEHPLSTFSIDVDTASYANVRRFLNEGRLPPVDAVRIEELINYFRFDYAEPRDDTPISVATELGPAPWNPKHSLALVGLRTAPIKQNRTPPRNLTFLLDVSGSMQPANRLPLVKNAMRMLADTLRPVDKVAIVVYAGASGLALPPTSGAHKETIQQAIVNLNAGGSTNGAAGIQLAYDTASANFIENGINRVILATDGDFNIGITNQQELTRLIEQKRDSGIFLSVLGVGDNNLKDSTMENLADKGNGNYNYLDSLQEARRVLIAEAGSTLVTVATDVKLQIEFNPRVVSAYRLVGYENRLLRKEDFNNDRKDAGEMGAGHTVTALYELVPAGEASLGADVDPLKYQRTPPPARPAFKPNVTELMTVKVRYKTPRGDTSKLAEFPVRKLEPRMSHNLGFAAAVAEFGMLLRRSEFSGAATWRQAMSLATDHRGEDHDGYRAEFVRLVDLASALDRRTTITTSSPRR
ncbi:MAG: von Willebrand factor type A domain-containing protein [Vicinamibacterales bacterium]